MTAALAMLSSGCLKAQDKADIAIARADGTQVTISAELATDEASWERGLMFRDSLPQNHGMLFVYPTPSMRMFWMKDTLIPLDMLFFAKNGELIFIYPNAKPKSLATVGPKRADVCSVLEIGGGEAKRLGINVGDRLVYDTECR